MSTEEAIEVLEATPLMRMERTCKEPCSKLGEAMGMAIQALKDRLEVEDDMK